MADIVQSAISDQECVIGAIPSEQSIETDVLDVGRHSSPTDVVRNLGSVAVDIAPDRQGITSALRPIFPLHGLSSRPSVTVAGIRIDALSFEQVVELIVARAVEGAEPAYVITPNANHVVLFQEDTRLREIYDHAFLVVPDGVPLLWAAAILGQKLVERVNGTDLFEALCAEASRIGLRVFLLGGREGAAVVAAARLRERHPALHVCGTYCPPLGFEMDPVESEKVLSAISAVRPHLLFVGLGAPKQETWMHLHARRLSVPVSVGIGVSFEFVAGIVPRAPRWMQRTGLEWLYRLGAEPSRLWRRYLFGNVRFCMAVGRQYFARFCDRRVHTVPLSGEAGPTDLGVRVTDFP